MRFEKKAWPKFFQKVLDGEKTCDVRLADVACKPGDILVLKEWDPEKEKYTGRVVEKKITYVMKTKEMQFWSEEEIEKHGLQIISFK